MTDGGRGSDMEMGGLTARPRPPEGTPLDPGLHRLGLSETDRDGLLYVPVGYDGNVVPLLVMLHGAGATARNVFGLVAAAADANTFVVVLPDARGGTWDVLRGGFGPDVAFIDAALDSVFDRFPTDPSRVAIGGFSDGASYALSLGLGNGELFSAVLAYSPGFAAPARQQGQPRLFVSHGVADRVLPIERCSRRLAPALRAAGYEVRYLEFDGGHVVAPEVVDESMQFWLGD